MNPLSIPTNTIPMKALLKRFQKKYLFVLLVIIKEITTDAGTILSRLRKVNDLDAVILFRIKTVKIVRPIEIFSKIYISWCIFVLAVLIDCGKFLK